MSPRFLDGFHANVTMPCCHANATLRGRAWSWRSFWAAGGRWQPVGRGLDVSWGEKLAKLVEVDLIKLKSEACSCYMLDIILGKKSMPSMKRLGVDMMLKRPHFFFFQNPSLSMSLSNTWDPNLCVKRSARTKSRYFFILMQSNKQVMLSFDRQGATGCHRCFGKPPFLLCQLHLFSLRRWTWGPLWWELCLVTQTAMAWRIRTTRSFF